MPISQLPYSNDFEDSPAYSAVAYAEALPYCWHRINDATGTYNYYPYINTNSTYLIHGGKSMYWYHATSDSYANNMYAVLPEIDLTAIDISDLTLARELWERIPQEKLQDFATVVINHCARYCAPLLPNGHLTILLITDTGTIYSDNN